MALRSTEQAQRTRPSGQALASVACPFTLTMIRTIVPERIALVRAPANVVRASLDTDLADPLRKASDVTAVTIERTPRTTTSSMSVNPRSRAREPHQGSGLAVMSAESHR